MNNSSRLELPRGVDGTLAQAVLHDRISAEYAATAQADWNAHESKLRLLATADRLPFPEQDHSHWDWQKKVSISAHLLACPTFAIECEGQAQGMMLINTDEYQACLPDEAGKSLVYVYFLAAAPWNLLQLDASRRFKGIGQILLRAAILQSLELEHRGRIGLHSLPQSEAYYDRQGFQCLGPDPAKDGLKYYELSAAAAAKFVT